MKIWSVIIVFLCTIFILNGCLKDNRGPEFHDKCKPSSFFNAAVLTEYGEYETRAIKGMIEHDIKYDQAAIGHIGRPWQEGIIPYYFDAGYKYKKRTLAAMRKWVEATDYRLQFVQRTDEKDYIKFISNNEGCWSYVGRIGGEQRLSISENLGCPEFIVVHEIGHALGLHHEHTRQDRDQYVQVNWCNIKDDMRYNFMKANRNFTIDFDEFDEDSIMMYPNGLFSKNNKQTLQGVNGHNVPSMNNRKLTEKDVAAVLQVNKL